MSHVGWTNWKSNSCAGGLKLRKNSQSPSSSSRQHTPVGSPKKWNHFKLPLSPGVKSTSINVFILVWMLLPQASAVFYCFQFQVLVQVGILPENLGKWAVPDIVQKNSVHWLKHWMKKGKCKKKCRKRWAAYWNDFQGFKMESKTRGMEENRQPFQWIEEQPVTVS